MLGRLYAYLYDLFAFYNLLLLFLLFAFKQRKASYNMQM